MSRDFIIVTGAPGKRLTAREIIAEVAQSYGLTYGDLIGDSRRREIVWPRQHAMWEVRRRTVLSLPQIGIAFGRRDHTTILHGVRAHEARIEEARGRAA